MTAAPSHAIVTGGSSGIGYGVAQSLAARGWAVSILALDDTAMARARQSLENAVPAGGFHAAVVDVTDRDAVLAAVARSTAEQGPPALLVTSAGIAKPMRFMDLPPTEFARQMDVNFHGTHNAVAAVYPAMAAAKAGRIALISSGAGLMGIFGHTAHAPTKFAVRGFGEALRSEARPKGISVTTCYLPDCDTPQFRDNHPIRPPETAAVSGAAIPWPVDQIAERIVTATLAGRSHVAPGLQMALVHRLSSPLAAILRGHVDRVVARVGQKSSGP